MTDRKKIKASWTVMYDFVADDEDTPERREKIHEWYKSLIASPAYAKQTGRGPGSKVYVGVDLASAYQRDRGSDRTEVIYVREFPDGTREVLECPEDVRKAAIAQCMKRSPVKGGDFLIELEDEEVK